MRAIAEFCDDGAFRERRKTRRVIRNVYLGDKGPKIGRYHVFYHNGSYWLKNGEMVLPLEPATGLLNGSYSKPSK